MSRRSGPPSSRERGFTLIELMVVVMIIAILAAIAIPTFLNTRKRSQDQAAKSNLRTALSSAQAVYSETQDFTLVNATALSNEEPDLTFVSGASTAEKEISVATTADRITLAVKSKSGTCHVLRHVVTPGGSDSGTQQGTGSCTASSTSGVTFTRT